MQKKPSSISKPDSQKSSATFFDGTRDSIFFKPFIQTKLTINQPNDVYEQEADAVAERIIISRDKPPYC
jgi:hypothetical protein